MRKQKSYIKSLCDNIQTSSEPVSTNDSFENYEWQLNCEFNQYECFLDKENQSDECPTNFFKSNYSKFPVLASIVKELLTCNI